LAVLNEVHRENFSSLDESIILGVSKEIARINEGFSVTDVTLNNFLISFKFFNLKIFFLMFYQF
jgi:hypothetical protein